MSKLEIKIEEAFCDGDIKTAKEFFKMRSDERADIRNPSNSSMRKSPSTRLDEIEDEKGHVLNVSNYKNGMGIRKQQEPRTHRIFIKIEK